jgi:SAM-dependent methyltransferase
MRRFRRLFAPLHSEARYYANYDYVRSIDLRRLGIYALLKKALAGRRRILDLGCGMGYVTSFLGATGVDINPKAVAMAKALYPKTHFKVASFKKLLKEGARWEALTCVNMIEHLEDAVREELFRAVPKLLGKHGRLFIVYDSMYHPLQLLSGFLHPGMLLTDPTHVYCWPQWKFRRLLEEHFFIEEDLGGNILSRGLPFTNSFATARLYVCRPR